MRDGRLGAQFRTDALLPVTRLSQHGQRGLWALGRAEQPVLYVAKGVFPSDMVGPPRRAVGAGYGTQRLRCYRA